MHLEFVKHIYHSATTLVVQAAHMYTQWIILSSAEVTKV